MGQSNSMFVFNIFIAVFDKNSFISNSEISPFTINQILIALYLLFIEILSISLTDSHCNSVVVRFTETESNSWWTSTDVFYSSVVLNEFSCEGIPITWYAVIDMRIELENRFAWFSMLTTHSPSVTSSFRNVKLRDTKVDNILDFQRLEIDILRAIISFEVFGDVMILNCIFGWESPSLFGVW